MGFRFQAIDAAGQTLTDVVEAASAPEASALLRERGLFVTRLDEDGATGTESVTASDDGGKGAKFRDVLLFTQQMSMLIRSGAQVIEALDAIEDQNQRVAWQRVMAGIRFDLQEGKPLSVALERYPKLFSGIYVNMITAGEASGQLGVAFDRLAALTRQQQEIRNRIIGAISYPLVLLCLCGAVIVIMLGFILPRFAEMFDTLGVELPVTTTILIAASEWTQAHWPYVLGSVAAAGTGTFLLFRSKAGRRWLSLIILRLPLFGVLIRNIIFARICRIWGQLLQSKVSLLEAIELVQRGTSNAEYKNMLGRVAEAVTEGNRVGGEMRASWLVPGAFAGAIATGESSGRLADSLLFVGSSLDDQNAEMLGSLTRVLEPIILAIMGVVVGVLAFSLFLPMFDMATAAGR